MTLEQLTEKALLLPAASRARLAEELFESVIDASDEELHALWDAVIQRRCDEVHSGAVQLIPGEQAIAEVRRAVGR
jgi:putative addiction module component (TIGR02574 family)